MSKVVVSQFITVDGVFQDPGGAEGFDYGGWAFRFDRGPEGGQFKLDELRAAGALLLGRVTYEGFAAVWPSVTDEEGFAEKMNGMPKFVVSTTIQQPAWHNSTVISGDVSAEVRRLKTEIEGDLLVAGSGQLVHTLREHDLVDEYRLMVYPVLLGAGKRLFGDASQSAPLRLVQTIPAGECIILIYHPVQAHEAGTSNRVQ